MIHRWSRFLSLGAYLLGSTLIWSARGSDSAAIFMLTQAVVLLLIWFADFFSTWIGAPPFGAGQGAKVIDQESPAWLIAAFGWLILVGVFVVTYFYA